MTALSKLKTSKKSKYTAQESSQDRLRRILREKLLEQREMIEAELKGQPLVKMTTQYVPNKLTGEIIRQDAPKQLRKWFWREPDGTVCMQLLYGSIKIPINGANTTIETKSLDKLPEVIGVPSH